MRFTIVPAGPEHDGWIKDSFAESARSAPPYAWVARWTLVDDFERRRHRPGATTLVAHLKSDPDCYLGWCSTAPGNEVIFAYTRYTMRRQTDLRIMTTLAEQAGVDFSKPVGVRYWTRAAERIGLKDGYRLYHKVTEDAE